ncbi:DUF1415 domain-containing protein [Undibacterium crateris]|uniref:DUF1415 domain-containing protein n=1 Tax=Undibacterium crateris TaxID=2528175 RepID=UPI001389F4E6|nr:DUF1415 domain-containing protein [Undibacterium crateris]NDI87513.1 DUF1415 family protein [Undibacterium crateris]
MSTLPLTQESMIAQTINWMEKAVIGLNLCPFAKAVHVKQQIRYVVSEAKSEQDLVEDLRRELEVLAEANPEKIETTLLICPDVLRDFMDFNDFLDVADALLEELDLAGILQIANFHPDYQFADSEMGDIENYTNRSPYPTLHLLREDSIDKAVEAFPEAEEIYERNMEAMRKLGHEGWHEMFADQPESK